MFKIILINMLIALPFEQALAQRVKRKGVEPIQKKQPDTKEATFDATYLNGKWQEVQRNKPKGKSMSFTDTLYIHFINADSVAVRMGQSMTMKGLAQMESGQLILAGDFYVVMKQSEKKLILDDGDYIRVLEKRDSFMWDELGHLKVDRGSPTQPVKLDPKYFSGRWGVYRTQSEPGSQPDKNEPIRSISIDSTLNDNTWAGVITTNVQGRIQSHSVTYTSTGVVLHAKGETYKQTFQVYVSNEKELVIGQSGVKYYFKKM